MLIGATTQNAGGSDWGTLAAACGPFTCRRSFNKAGDFSSTHGVPPTFAASNANIDAGLGVVSIYSFKPDIVLMAGDALDAAVDGFLDSIPQGHKAILTVWHEGDVKVRQEQFTVKQWRDSLAHFADLVHTHANDDLKVAAILSAYQPTAPGTRYEDMLGDGLISDIDYLLVDGYTDLGSGDSAWKASADFASEAQVGWGIAEIGTRTGAVDPGWMAVQARWALDHDAVCLCWFNNSTDGVTPTPGTGTAAQAAAHTISVLLQSDPEEFTN